MGKRFLSILPHRFAEMLQPFPLKRLRKMSHTKNLWLTKAKAMPIMMKITPFTLKNTKSIAKMNPMVDMALTADIAG